MKKCVLFLLLFFGCMQWAVVGFAQRRDTGNWELGFYKTADGERGNPFYQVVLPGLNFNNNESVKLIIKVDYAVINGFTLSLLDKNGEYINLGEAVRIGFSENWRTETRIKNFIEVDRTHIRGQACYVESQSQINKLADLLCKEDFAIFIYITNGDNAEIYGTVIGNETQHLEGAVDNLLIMHNSYN